MDKIEKSLRKLPNKDQVLANTIIARLVARKFEGLYMAKLKGHGDIYRVKAGRLRVVFRLTADAVIILRIGLRSEKTYRGF